MGFGGSVPTARKPTLLLMPAQFPHPKEFRLSGPPDCNNNPGTVAFLFRSNCPSNIFLSRSEERRVGKEWGRKGRMRWAAENEKKKRREENVDRQKERERKKR